VVEGEELETLQPKASRAIEIEDFVDLADIDPLYFENPYYLVPDRNASKPYKLLVEAMTALQKVAIGHIILRSKAHLVAIRPLDGALCVETMRYADEVLPPAQVLPEDAETAEPTARELEMAKQLVDALATDFEPDKYHDAYREQLMSLIERKAAGEEIVAEPQVEEQGRVVDLMAALEQSLARAGRGGSGDEDEADEELPPAATAKRAAKKRTRARKSA
jgi:DNA end-binding protein Ku